MIFLFPLALVWIARQSQHPVQAFKYSWLCSSLAYSFSLYWIAFPVHNFAYLPWIVSGACPLLLGFYLGLYPALFTLIIYWADKRLSWLALGLLAGSCWSTLEYLRGTLFTGFPWLTIAQALSPWTWSIQSVSFLGAYGLSGLLTACAVWFYVSKETKKAFLVPLLILLALTIYGVQKTSVSKQGNSLSVSIIQGNIDQNHKWEPKYQNKTVNKYIKLSRAAIAENSPELIVWPETAMPFYLQEETLYKKRLQNFVLENKIHLLTGSPGYVLQKNKQYHLFNRAYLFSPSGKITDVYEKEKLVPFGEYVPLKSILPFLDKLVAGIGDFVPGKKISPLHSSELALGTLICYETIFAGLVQKRIADGANLLVNISNDAWFGPTSAPIQHLHQAVLRAVEQNRFLVRSTNTGISAFIDPQGNIIKKSACFQKETLYLNQADLISERTLFSRYYSVFKGLYFILAGFFLLLALFSPPKLKIKE